MSVVFMPYLGAIRASVQDAFPNSRVDVWAEESISDRCVVIKAVVDNDTAYTDIYPGRIFNEAQISELLIALLKETRADDE